MPTRRSHNQNERPQERFLSNPAFAQRRGILANAVAAKAQLYRSSADRELLYFVQAMSMQPGGIRSFAAELLAIFPDRIRVPVDPAEAYAGYLAGANGSPVVVERRLAQFLETLCIDPSVDMIELRQAPEAVRPWFADLVSAINEFRQQRRVDYERSHVTTSIGRIIDQQLDYVLSTRRMVIIEGQSGSGKTFQAESWCLRNAGHAVFVSLSGITHRTGLFQKISAALGLAHNQQASSKIQARIESHLAQTKTMLVIDEAQFLWPQHKRSNSAPELVDWIDTALVNNEVPIALITTDQFAKLKQRCEKQVGWNSDQLVHRTARYVLLPGRPSRYDLLAVAENLLKRRWSDELGAWLFDPRITVEPIGQKIVAQYGGANELPLASMRSIVEDAQWRARQIGRPLLRKADLVEAIEAQM